MLWEKYTHRVSFAPIDQSASACPAIITMVPAFRERPASTDGASVSIPSSVEQSNGLAVTVPVPNIRLANCYASRLDRRVK